MEKAQTLNEMIAGLHKMAMQLNQSDVVDHNAELSPPKGDWQRPSLSGQAVNLIASTVRELIGVEAVYEMWLDCFGDLSFDVEKALAEYVAENEQNAFEQRFESHGEDFCDYVTMQECRIGGTLQDQYEGAGEALIAVNPATGEIMDLSYNLNRVFFAIAHECGFDVYFGICSCVSFCEPAKVDSIEDVAAILNAKV